ncbi:MAG: tetratricopeptide repeat protein [Nitrospirae bacterium]|nr:tetratricopeptide repeat protein [Nitrospirota bacterium]
MRKDIKTAEDKKARLLVPVALIGFVSFAVYFNTLFNDFVYDDVLQVLENHWIRDVRYLPEMFSKAAWGFRPEYAVSNYYRPLMHVIFMVNYHLFGLKPWGFHLVNILFHTVNSVLVFILVSKLFGEDSRQYAVDSSQPAENRKKHIGKRQFDAYCLLPAVNFPSAALIAALLFAVHPIHTEAVAWIGAVTDLSYTLFYLLSLYFYMRSTDGTLHKGFYSLSLTCFVLSLLCKEPAVTLPIILIVYDLSLGKEALRGAKRDFTALLKRQSPYFFVTGLYLFLRSGVLGSFAPVKAHMDLTTYQHVINVFPLFSRYLEQLIFPVHFNAFIMLHPIASVLETKGMLSLMAAAVYVALTVAAYRKNRPAFFALMLLVIPLLPVFYVPALGEASLAERYLYLPSFGFVLLLVMTFSWVGKKGPRYATSVLLLAYLVAGLYSLQTVKRNAIWKDNFTLFSDMVRQSPGGELPHGMLGNAFMSLGRVDEAIGQYRIITLKLNPNSAAAHRNLGLCYMQKGMTKEAVEEYQRAVAIAPADLEARRGLVLAYEKAVLLDEAIGQYRLLLDLDPGSAETHGRLAVALAKKGMTKEAVSHYRRALAINPGYVDAHYNLGSIYANSGQTDEAIEHFEAAVKLRPDNAFYRNILGIAYGQKGSFDKAVEQFEAAVRLAPSESAYRSNLERALKLKGSAGRK